MSYEEEEKHKVIAAVKEIVSKIPLKSGITLDGLSLKPKHELDAFSMGSGMTARTIENLRTDFPVEVIEHLVKNGGTTIFLGNGTSLVPLEISQRQRAESLSPNPKVIIDQVDLALLLEDLISVEAQLRSKGFSDTFDIGERKSFVQKLIDASIDSSQQLSIKTGLIGKSNFSDINDLGDVVFNCYGPSIETLLHQMRMVKPGGVLYATYYPDDFRRMADKIGEEALNMIESIELKKKIVKVTRKK